MAVAWAPDQLVKAASARFPGAGVAVYAWSAAEGLLVPAACNAVAAADGLAPRRLGVGAGGRAAQRGASVLLGNYGAAVGDATPAGRAGVHAAMAVPLTDRDSLLGVVSIGLDDARLRFGPDDLLGLERLVDALLDRRTGRSARSGAARRAAVEALYASHYQPAVTLARRLLASHAEAEEVAQDVFLAIWRTGATHLPERASERSWVLTLVRRRAIDLLRARGRRPSHTLAGMDLPSLPETEALARVEMLADLGAIWAGLRSLPVEQQVALELAYFGGLSHTELAARLGVPVGTVKGRLRLALQRLRAAITPRTQPVSDPS